MIEAPAEDHDEDPEARWDAIQRKLEPHADVLARQGTLVAKDARGRRVWAVRFPEMVAGRRVQRSIYIGDRDELVERAKGLLEQYRLQGSWADEVEGYARLAARAGGVARLLASSRRRPG